VSSTQMPQMLSTNFTIDPAQTRLAAEFKHSRPLFSCRFDPTGRFVFAGAQDNLVQRWDLATGQRTELAGHDSWVRGLAFLPGGGCLYSGDYAGRLACWPYAVESPQPMRTHEAHQGWLRSISVCPDGQLIATAGNDNMVRLWSTADGKLVRELAGHNCHVYNAAFDPTGRHLVSADLKGVVKHWDVATSTLVRTLDAAVLWKYDNSFRADIGGIRGMSFSADGRWLACAGITDVTNAFAGVGKPVIVVFDWLTGRAKPPLRPQQDFQGASWGVVYHPTGVVIGVGGGGGGGAMWFWRPDEPQSFFTFKLPAVARDLDLHPDGKRVAVAQFDGVLRVYDISPKPAA